MKLVQYSFMTCDRWYLARVLGRLYGHSVPGGTMWRVKSARSRLTDSEVRSFYLLQGNLP